MKSEIEQPLQMRSAAVWAEEGTATTRPQKSPEVKWVTALAVTVTAVTMAGSIWLYISGLETLRSLAAPAADTTKAASTVSKVVDHATHWATQMGMVTAAGGAGFIIVTVFGSWWWQQRSAGRSVKHVQGLQRRIQKLQDQLVDSKISEEEARKEQAELEQRLNNLSQTHVSLQEELNQRKRAEKSLTQQTQNLERSKDVLELHVQARTQELVKMQRRNELILNSAGDGICGFDLQGKATFVNPAAARITGWKIDDMIGKTEEEIFFSRKVKSGAAVSSIVKDEQGQPKPDQLFYHKDGSCFSVEYVRTTIKEQGREVGAVVMFKDITERKLAEDKLAHKAAELARSNAELEQFAFVASHDLQEPLRKIQAFGDRLKTKCDAVQLQDGRDYLERMQNAAARMQSLINDLLAFSRVIKASQPFVPVNLNAITKDVLVDLEHSIEKTKAVVQVGSLPTIDADPMQMRQVLQNLLSNALKFQSPNAVPVIKIEAQQVTRDQIREDAGFPKPPSPANPDDKFCVLTVQDNGIGFEEEYLEKIFAVFQRLHGRSEYDGTGIGLAVCRRITDRHRGIITAQSKLGEGSTFIVILPVCQPITEVPQ
ncbi:MAG: Multi-sensor signal transduction histidine kinase [Pedosphaera sp.]|nr:Multi-sensor signal transduction histidine kinase [Pedosphaera sp.]